jgi:hypothetical protein
MDKKTVRDINPPEKVMAQWISMLDIQHEKSQTTTAA